MKPRRSSSAASRIASTGAAAAAILIVLAASFAARGGPPEPTPVPGRPRIFHSSIFSIDQKLSRPFDRDVPLGSTGDRVWASSPQGWAFRDDVHWVYLTNLRALDLEIRDEFGLLAPSRASATYYPSHVHYDRAERKEMTASASFTFVSDKVENPLVAPYRPEKRWTCWSSGARHDWYDVNFGMPRTLSGFDVFFFADAPGGGCRAPQAFEVRAFDSGLAAWSTITPLKAFPQHPSPGENRVRFEPVRSRRFRLQFRNAGDHFYTGIYGLKPSFEDERARKDRRSPLAISCDKFITPSDCLVTLVRAHNPSDSVQTIYVDPVIDFPQLGNSWHWESDSGQIIRADGPVKGHEPRALAALGRYELHGFPVESSFRYAVVDDPPADLKVAGGGPAGDITRGLFARRWLDHPSPEAYKSFGHCIDPGKTKVFKAVLELRKSGEPSKIDSILKVPTDRRFFVRAEEQDARDPLAAQVERYQSWFDGNLAYFACSDPWVRQIVLPPCLCVAQEHARPPVGPDELAHAK